MNDPQGPPIRAAVAGDARVLSDLAFRSKAHWGYDAAFMEACREDLRVSEQDILTSSVYVHEHADRINGFYQLRPCGDQVEMVALFVEPRAMGHGIGKALWHHAMGTAKELGCDEVILQSEPHAAGFYRAYGCHARRAIAFDRLPRPDAATDALSAHQYARSTTAEAMTRLTPTPSGRATPPCELLKDMIPR